MSYLVLARKWRPQTFDEILGQEAVVKTLKNAILQDRVAHAFLFSGPRGVGKTSLARVLAKALNCQNQDGATTEPCGQCPACVEITAGSSVDVLEIDGASNTSVDNIRELRETVRYLPSSFRTKVYIIDEVHMLSISAFNALLKTLEEPPPHVVFMFATTESHKIPATILSRCQRYDLRRVGVSTLVGHLGAICASENISLADGSLKVIAREAEGSVRDSLSLLDQVLSFGAEDLTEDDVLRILGVVDRTVVSGIGRAALEGDAGRALSLLFEADEAGVDVKVLSRELLRWFRNLMVVKIARDPGRLMDLADLELGELGELAAGPSLETIQRLFNHLARLDEDLGRSEQPRLLLEMTLVRMAITPSLAPVAELLARLDDLEQRMREGGAAVSGGRLEEAGAIPLFSAPEPAAAKPCEDPGAEPTWEDFMAYVEEKDGKLFALLSAGAFVGRSGREWRLSFSPGNPLMERLKGKDNSANLRTYLTGCFGDGHRLVFTEDSSLAAAASRPNRYKEESVRRKEAMDDPVVKALLEDLGGELDEFKVK